MVVKFAPSKPTTQWEIKEKQRLFWDRLGSQLGHSSLEDWYKVKKQDIIKTGGTELLQLHKGSLSSALQSVYTEHYWELDKFGRELWTLSNQRHFFDRLFIQLGYKSMDDWYDVTAKDILKHGGGGFPNSYNNSPSLALQKV